MGPEQADGAGQVWVQDVPILVPHHQVQIQVPVGPQWKEVRSHVTLAVTLSPSPTLTTTSSTQKKVPDHPGGSTEAELHHTAHSFNTITSNTVHSFQNDQMQFSKGMIEE